MKKLKINKLISIIICTAVLCTSTIAAFALGSSQAEKKTEAEKETAQADKTVHLDDTSDEISKSETVYVIADADGNTQKVIVSNWIENNGSPTIDDKTTLENLESVKGNISYTASGDSKVWDAAGGDVYYKGTSSAELPVDVKISYMLNGTNISSADLVGKSGKVAIRFDYKNKKSEKVEIDGKQIDIYVPFVMLTGLILDNNNFTNIEITNGKIINDGNRSVAIGFAMPGMQENIGVDTNTFTIPDYVEITADTTDFELSTTLTVATNELINKIDTSKFGEFDRISQSIEQLDSAAKQLIDGSSALYDGTKELTQKLPELVNGVNEISDGVAQLYTGSDGLYTGSIKLKDGINELNSGLANLNSNNTQLNSGAKQIFETLLKTADSALADAGIEAQTLTISNYSKVLDTIISSLDEATIRKIAEKKALETVTAKVNENKTVIREQIEAGYYNTILEGVLKAGGMNYTAQQYNQMISAGYVDMQTQTKVKTAVSAQIDTLVQQQTEKLISENMAGNDVASQINTAVAQAKNGKSSIQSLKAQLDDYNKFYIGLSQYTNGVSTAYAGSKKLAGGSQELSEGAKNIMDGLTALKAGVASLKDGVGTLSDGADKLSDGAKELSEGMKKFYDEGISKLTQMTDADLANIGARLKATVDVSSDYNSYSGISDNMNGTVRFVYRTGSVINK